MPRRKPSHDKHALAEPFGYLVALDLYACRPGVCDDLEGCYDFLIGLVSDLKMTMQSPPFIFRSPSQYADKAGLSGWVPLIESGIQFHTLTPKNFVTIDVYCCHDFDEARVAECARRYFGPREVEMKTMVRGVKYHEVV